MYKRGSVVLIPFPFSDLAGDKVRPALIISNTRSNDVIVVFIASKQKVDKSKYRVQLDPNTDNGLKVRSNIICDKLATLDKKIILGELGFVSSDVLKEVEKILRDVLGLLNKRAEDKVFRPFTVLFLFTLYQPLPPSLSC